MLAKTILKSIGITAQPNRARVKVNIGEKTNNNLLQLQNVNYEFSIIFEIYPRYSRRESRSFSSNNQNQLNNISNQLQALNRPTFIKEEVEEINDTHPFQNKSEIKHKTDRLILDQLIDQIS